MTRNRLFISAALPFCLSILRLSVCVCGDYVLEVHVQSYSNPTNRCFARSGGCCDLSTSGVCAGTSRCDTYFTFCLRSFNTSEINRDCNVTAVTSADVLDDGLIDFTQPSFLGLDNPLLLSGLSTDWQGVQLYVETIDRDGFFVGGADDDLIDSFVIDVGSDQPIGAALSTGTPGNNIILEGLYGYGMIGLTGRVLCAENYYGDRCQFLDVANQCLTNNITCSDQGTCVDGTLSYTCNCNPGYTGTNCELVDNCLGVICSGNGVCQNGVDTYTCECTTGFTGTNCEIGINECQGENCDDHGTCQDLVNDFICLCDPGYTGRNCEVNVNECEGQNCSGNGRCQDGINLFTCDCDSGYTGPLCGDVDDCVGVNCSGNGQCMDGVNNFTCLCQPGFTGNLCSVVIQLQETISIIIGGVLGAVIVLILIIMLVLIVTLILKRKDGRHKEVTVQEHPSDVDIELENNMGYGVNEQGAVATDHYYDYIDPTTNTEEGPHSGQTEDQDIDMNVNVMYGVRHVSPAISNF